jgi:hypothetical protein
MYVNKPLKTYSLKSNQICTLLKYISTSINMIDWKLENKCMYICIWLLLHFKLLQYMTIEYHNIFNFSSFMIGFCLISARTLRMSLNGTNYNQDGFYFPSVFVILWIWKVHYLDYNFLKEDLKEILKRINPLNLPSEVSLYLSSTKGFLVHHSWSCNG